MLHLIIGPHGSGKSRQMTARIQHAATVSNGNVVCITHRTSLRQHIPHTVRLIALSEFGELCTFHEVYAFVCGLLSGNYDISDVFLDAENAVPDATPAELTLFLALLSELAGTREVTITVALSAQRADVPDELCQMAADVYFCE